MGKSTSTKGSVKETQGGESITAPLVFTGLLIVLPILYLLLKKKPNIKLPESYKPKPLASSSAKP